MTCLCVLCGSLENKKTTGFNSDLHIGYHEGDGLVVGDCLAHGLSLHGVSAREQVGTERHGEGERMDGGKKRTRREREVKGTISGLRRDRGEGYLVLSSRHL